MIPILFLPFGLLASNDRSRRWYLSWVFLRTVLAPCAFSRHITSLADARRRGTTLGKLNPKSVGIRVDGVGRHGVTPAPHTPYTFSAGCVWCSGVRHTLNPKPQALNPKP